MDGAGKEKELAVLHDEWRALLNSDAANDERVLQDYFERHPCLLPGAHTLDTNSGHPPWPQAMITQPKLPGLSDKFPDFMWIAADSAFLYPILIEIETPSKAWFHQDAPEQHSQFTTAVNQLRRWRAWFERGRNHVAFYDMYRIPRELQDLTLAPRYVLVHGRRTEASRSPAYLALRGQLGKSDERLITFDHLVTDARANGYLTVRVNEDGFELLHLPSGVGFNDLEEDVLANIVGLREALTARGEGMAEELPSPGYRFRPPMARSERRRRRHAGQDPQAHDLTDGHPDRGQT